MIRFRRLRLWWAGQHARHRLPWCYQCRLGWGARRSGEFYEHDEPLWLVLERFADPSARTYAAGNGQNWYWDREYGLRRLS